MTTWNRIFFQSPSRIIMEIVSSMHDYVLLYLLRILLLVLMNVAYLNTIKGFSLNFYENHIVETVWTVAPFVLLIFIITPSLATLYIRDTCVFCGLTVRVIGHQWYWTYFYKEIMRTIMDSYIEPEETSRIRLLEVDNRLIIPTNMPIRFLVSSADVIHSWTIPSFGVKFDALPGRINQFCVTPKRSGVFFGQCSEICGANHRFIPIVVESIPFKIFF